jgi:type II secretory pathway pseudopilin PulG
MKTPYSLLLTTYSHSSRAFTLVETLVAIAILMISISGPLAVANKALTASLYAKDQSTASFLAQEEMEIIKNKKDNLALNVNNWLSLAGTLSSSCGSPGLCDYGITNGSPVLNSSCSGGLGVGCPLFINSIGYNDSSGGTGTIFSRYFYLISLGPSEYQATVVVNWKEGTVPNAVTMSSELFNVAP